MNIDPKHAKKQVIIEKCLDTYPTGRTTGATTYSVPVEIDIGYGTSLSSIEKVIKRIKSKFGAKYSDLIVHPERTCGCYSDCNCSPSYIVHGTRLETDEELAARIESYRQRELKKEQAEREQYELLKAKFGE